MSQVCCNTCQLVYDAQTFSCPDCGCIHRHPAPAIVNHGPHKQDAAKILNKELGPFLVNNLNQNALKDNER